MSSCLTKYFILIAFIVAFGISGCNVQNPLSKVSSHVSTQKIKEKITQKLATLGVITGFGTNASGTGSVFINGVEYKFNGTSITVNGKTYTVNDVQSILSLLKQGMVVNLNGTDLGNGTGQANSISVENSVVGEAITNNIASDGSLDIMGLTVQTNGDTVFDSNVADVASLDGIKPGNIVQVSGFSTGINTVLATRIDVISDSFSQGTLSEIKGVVSNLTATSFDIGNLTVNYANANLDPNLLNSLADGISVDVTSDTAINGGVLNALAVSLAKVLGVKPVENQSATGKTELEGIITSVVSGTEIVVNQTSVLLNDTTQYRFGDASTAANGLRVTVFGSINADGKLVADSIQYTPTGDIKLQGQITSLDVANNSFTIFDKMFKLNNSAVTNDAMTEGNHLKVEYNFDASALSIGDWLNLKAYANGDGSFTVMKLERENHQLNAPDQLQGKVESIDPLKYEMVVDGITVDFSAQANMTAAAGDTVKLKGMFLGGIFVVDQLQSNANNKDLHYVSGIEKSANEVSSNDAEKGAESSQDGNGLATDTNSKGSNSAPNETNEPHSVSGTDDDVNGANTADTNDSHSSVGEANGNDSNGNSTSGSKSAVSETNRSDVSPGSGTQNNNQINDGQATGDSKSGGTVSEAKSNDLASGVDNSQSNVGKADNSVSDSGSTVSQSQAHESSTGTDNSHQSTVQPDDTITQGGETHAASEKR